MTTKPPIHGKDHCPGGSDPIPIECLGISGGAAAMLRATRTAFTQSGAYPIPWTDVDTDDTSIFGVTTNINTNDKIVLKVQGLYLAVVTVFPTVASTDYSVQIDLGGSMTPPAQDFPNIMGAVDGDATMGAQAMAFRLMHARSIGGSTTGVHVVRAGTKAFTYASLYVIYWPSTVPDAILTDIG